MTGFMVLAATAAALGGGLVAGPAGAHPEACPVRFQHVEREGSRNDRNGNDMVCLSLPNPNKKVEVEIDDHQH